MWTKSVLALAIFIAAAGCSSAPQGRAEQQALQTQLVEQENVPKHQQTIEKFAKTAAKGDVNALLKQFGEVTLQANDKEKLKDYLSQQIVPFFADYQKLASHSESIKVADNRGNVGRQYYSFYESKAGNLQPFVITLFPEKKNLAVTSIEVGQCLPGYHPQCPATQ